MFTAPNEGRAGMDAWMARQFGQAPPTTAPPRRQQVGVPAAGPQPASVGVPQFQHPGFVDARPEAQRQQFPMPPARQPASPARQPAPAERPGVQGPAANLPSPGVKYPASQQFRFPEGYGWGYGERDGMRTYSYETPEQKQRQAADAAAYRQRMDEDRNRRMMDEYQGMMRGLSHGSAGVYGSMSPRERAALMEVVGGQINAMRSADLARLEADADPRRSPEYARATIDLQRAQADRARAEADPQRSLDLLRQINADPQLRALYLAGKGVDPTTISALPAPIAPAPDGTPGINAGNLRQHLDQPQNVGMRDLLAQEDMGLADRIARASQFPGFEDINSPNRQMFDAWLRQAYTDPKDWLRETYVPPDPDDATPVLGRLGGFFNAALTHPIGSMLGFGGGSPAPGTGIWWRQNHEDAMREQDLIQRYALSPY